MLLTCAMFAVNAMFATVRTVNNNLTSPGQFTTLTAVIAASADGDTVLVHGSPVNYGGITLSKRLTFIGTGHNPQKQSPLRSFMDHIVLATGSTGSTFVGLELLYSHPNATDIDNITFIRCEFRDALYFGYSNLDNWRIESCVFMNTAVNIHGYHYGVGNGGYNNFQFNNNVFNGYIRDFNNVATNYNYFNNNLFLCNTSVFQSYYIGSIRFCYFNNNIFYRASPSYNVEGSCLFSNNLSYQCSSNSFINGTNLTNVNPMFENFPNGGAFFDYAHNYKLQALSPAKNAGNDGTDLGPWGGSVVYDQNGIPSMPVVRAFNITSSNSVAPGGTLQVNIISTVKQ